MRQRRRSMSLLRAISMPLNQSLSPVRKHGRHPEVRGITNSKGASDTWPSLIVLASARNSSGSLHVVLHSRMHICDTSRSGFSGRDFFSLLRYDGPFAINQRRYATNESSERTSISLSPHVYPGWPCLCRNNTPTSATEFSDVGRATAIASAGSISAPQFQLDVERARYGRFEYRGSRKLLARSRHVDRSSRQLQHSLGTDPRSA